MEQRKLIRPRLHVNGPDDRKKRVKIAFPPYWEKRRNRLNAEFVREVEETVVKEVEESDDYGFYKTGMFLYKSVAVVVKRDNGLWSLHIMSEHPVGLPLIREVRYKFLPDNLLMAQLFPSREEDSQLSGVMLHEVSTKEVDEEDSDEQA